LKPWHGVPGLIHGVAQANERTTDPSLRWRLLIVGDGPGREDLQRLAESLNVPAAFTGAIPPADVPGLLADCDAAAAPYPPDTPGGDDYFSPLKVFEYMAAALPVVASAVGQIPSIIQNGRTGILVPPGEPAALANALIRLGEDPNLRERLGLAARSDAVQRFSWSGVLSRITGALPPARRLATQ
jgi:glycosyltransferase involved in cell wall biosynthesis